MHPAIERIARRYPKSHIVLRTVAGIILAIAAGSGFAAIAEDVPEMGAMVRTDSAIAGYIVRHSTEGGESFFVFVSRLGGAVLIALLAVIIIWRLWKRDWFRAAAIAITASGSALLDEGLKVAFRRVRPESAAEFIHSGSFSFPSGHAMSSLVGYGFLLFLALRHIQSRSRRRALIAAAALLIGAVGFSRMYLGVHFLTDVIAGYLAGIVWLLACIGSYKLARRHQATGAATQAP